MLKKAAIATLAILSSYTMAQADKIKIGMLPLAHDTPMYAEELGIFKKNGLDVEVVQFQSGPAMVQAVLSGDLIGGSFGPIPSLNLASQGRDLYFLTSDGMPTPDHPAGTIMIRPDDTSAKTLADLKGKSIGQLGPGTLTYMWLLTGEKKYGLKPDELKQVFVPFPQMGQLLSSKQVDAVYAWPPFDTMIEQTGQGKKLVDENDWVPYAVASAFGVSSAWADSHPDDTRRLVKSWIEAGRWVDDHKAEARKIAQKYLRVSDSVAGSMRMLYWPRNGYQLIPSIWDQYNMMVQLGQLKPVSDPAAMIEKYWIAPQQKFITPVLKELGIEEDAVTKALLKMPLPYLEGGVDKYLAPWER